MGKKRGQWKKLKPQRPKRPKSAFQRFLSEFSKISSTDPKAKGRVFFREAAEAWNAQTDMEKALYEDHDEIEAYRKKLQEYQEKTKAMKGPASAFALYTRHYWKIHNLSCDNRTEFGKIQERILKDWKNLDKAERNIYKASANLLQALFQSEKAAVLAKKRPFNVDWNNEGLNNLGPVLYRQPGGKKTKKEEKEQDQQEKDQYEESGKQEKNDTSESADTETDDEYEEKFDYGMEED